MTHYEWKIFQIMKIVLILQKRNNIFVVDVIKPNFHRVEKYVISLEFHLNPKKITTTNFWLQLLKNVIHLYCFFRSMVCSLNEEQHVFFDNIFSKKKRIQITFIHIFY